MKLKVLPKTVMLTAVICALVSPTTLAKQMYRWVDEHGKVTFSDQVPPSQIQHKRETLDKNAQVVSVVEKPKTKEQLEMEKRLNAEKQRQEKLIAGQKTHDKMLLSSFLDATSMQATHDTKILALVSQEKEKQNNIKKLEEDLKRLGTEVATLEKSNKKTPDATRNAIEDNQKKIAQLNVEIKQLQDKRAKINKDFAIDKERFDFLKSLQNKTDTAVTAALNEDKLNQRIGLFTCDSAEQCDKAWKVAKDFVKTNSTTKLNVDTDKLVMTNDPVRADDLSLSVSKRLVENNKQQIFLDIRCVETVQGKEVCVNPKAESLRTQFSDYVRTALGTSSNTTKPIEATTTEVKK